MSDQSDSTETRICSQCGHENPAAFAFCLSCAASLSPSPATSPQAATTQAATTDVVHPLASTPAAPESLPWLEQIRNQMPARLREKVARTAAEMRGERREVTVLFLDLANFTTSSHHLDSEDLYLIVNEAMALLARVVYDYEGHIDKFTGDGLMALFGAPITHENDPERAVRAAMDMQSALGPFQERIQTQYGIRLDARVGVNTGYAVAGSVGPDMHMEYTVVGDTVNIASRLEQAAQPGTVLVSQTTYLRTRPLIDYEALSPLHIKGLPQPLLSYRPLQMREIPGRLRGLPGLQVPMVGRQAELEALLAAEETVRTTNRQMVVAVSGEAGLGKSRLVSEFLKRTELVVCAGGCQATTRNRPHWLVADLVRNALGLKATDAPARQWETLRAFQARHPQLGPDFLPHLLGLLSLESEDPETTARLALLDASMRQQQLHASARQLLLASLEGQPGIFVLEDLHWLDSASLDFLIYLLQTTTHSPALFVLVARSFREAAVLRPLRRVAARSAERFVALQLHHLTEEEELTLAQRLVPQDSLPASALRHQLVRRSEGIPFYMEELVRMLIDQEGLVGEPGHWQIGPSALSLLDNVPPTLSNIVLARFDQMPSATRWILQRAAVLGRAFPTRLLTSLNGDGAPVIRQHLREAAARQFLVAEQFGEEEGYAFRHALIQRALYSTLLRRDRQRIHQVVAQAISQSRADFFGDEAEYNRVLAYHLTNSQAPHQAIPYLIATAEDAARRFANEVAIDYYQQAVALLEQGDDAGADDAADAALELAAIRIELGTVLKRAGRYEAAGTILADVLAALPTPDDAPANVRRLTALGLRELGDVRLQEGAYDRAIARLQAALAALTPDDRRQHRSLWRSILERLAFVHLRQGSPDEAFTYASTAVQDQDPLLSPDPVVLASLYNIMGGSAWFQGSLVDATHFVERSLRLYASVGYDVGVAKAHTNLATLYFRRGNWNAAAESLEEARRLFERIGDFQNLALVLTNLGWTRTAMGDHVAARDALNISLALRQELQDSYGTAHTSVTLGQLAVIEGRWDDAARHASTALELTKAIGNQEFQIYALECLAQVAARQGDLEEGLRLAQQALDRARSHGLLDIEASCLRTLGRLQAEAGQFAEAESLLQLSERLCAEQDDQYRRGQALLDLGITYASRLLTEGARDSGWSGDAQGLLREAVEIFTELGAQHDKQLATAALEQWRREHSQG